MVCGRCIMVVKSELEKLGLKLSSIQLGEIETIDPLSDIQKNELATHLKTFGFELIDDKKRRIIDKIKTIIIDVVQNKNNEINSNLSDYLSNQLLQDYNTLSNLFSEVEGTTIKHYFIAQKIEKVKELLQYEELTLSEIANKLHYSDVAYLSNQFKKATGITPTTFKLLQENQRVQIEDL
jgi:YesN/AraC family two-component response regulator